MRGGTDPPVFHRKYNIDCNVCQVIGEKINKKF